MGGESVADAVTPRGFAVRAIDGVGGAASATDVGGQAEPIRFITWCIPGIPIAPGDLRFARVCMVGEGADDAARARDTALLATQATNLFRLVDFIPEVNGQRTIAFHPGSKSLSSTYEATLRASKIADTPLTDDEKKRLLTLAFPSAGVRLRRLRRGRS